ncbi:MAG: hypothetical protein R3B82_03440 [Sandaracinaceae bacterium]
MASPSQSARFGAFEGVFTPTLLTILGVIMYLREGWVVGHVGLAGAWGIVGLASGITVCTALSLSSIATNVRLGAGGPFAVITRSLGLELGGSIGIPLYLSQALAVAMYIFGLREGWCWIFPDHPAWLVDGIAFAVVLGLGAASASLAFRVQFVVMAVIFVSLLAVFGTWAVEPVAPASIEWWRGEVALRDAGVSFWAVFAVFFPAATGILAGANMSGELRDPRRSIPVGTLSATALATVIYAALAFWLATTATGDELRSSYTVMIDHSLFAPLVLAGLLGATFSSALTSLVGAPRILRALAQHGVAPGAGWLVKDGDGEPRRGMLVTAGVVILALSVRDLNAIAPLITLFFLITYAMINIVVLLEQRLAVVSFRPRLRLPWVVPLLGALGCIFAMFVVNPTFSLVAVAVVLGVYGVLMRRKLRSNVDDVRSGLFLMVAEWAARRSSSLPRGQARAWKANLLVPLADPLEVRGLFELIVDLARPYGSITLLGLQHEGAGERLHDRVTELANDFTDAGVHTTATVLEAEHEGRAVVHAMQTLREAFLRPNILFVTPRMAMPHDELAAPIRHAAHERMAVVVTSLHPTAGLGRRRHINVWIRPQEGGWNLQEGLRMTNTHLMVLVAYLLQRSWEAEVVFVCAVPPSEHEEAQRYLEELVDVARIPEAEVRVLASPFPDCLAEAPDADLSIFGLPDEGELGFTDAMIAHVGSSCVFVRDSGEEDALA